MAIASDVYPLFHYEKRYYMVISSALGLASLLVLSFASLEHSVYLAPFLLFFVVFEIVLVSLLMEMAYVAQTDQNPEFKRHILTWVLF